MITMVSGINLEDIFWVDTKVQTWTAELKPKRDRKVCEVLSCDFEV